MEELALKIKSLLDALDYVGYQVSSIQPKVINSYAEWLDGKDAQDSSKES